LKLSEISDTVKVGSVIITLIAGATTTTLAVRANTEAVNELTSSVQDLGKRIDSLERWKIESDAYARAVKDIKHEQEAPN